MTVLPGLREGEVDGVLTDPPYHLAGGTRFGNTRSTRGFMNKEWDGGNVAFQSETWETVARVVRPGGYLLAFGGPRTVHRLTCAIEDGGWEIVDTLMWLYGQGFPKHESKLKPAYEPIILARKDGPVHPLSIDACRIPFANGADEQESKAKNRHADFGSGARDNQVYGADNRPRGEHGNYEAAAAQIDEQTGDRRSSSPGLRATKNIMKLGGENRRPSHGADDGTARPGYADTGGASRFFYCPKASRAERDAGLEGLAKKPLHWSNGEQNPGSFQSAGTDKTARNHHPTVKPIALMRWLVRLITPPGGTVLDPFVGSGSTGCACAIDGFSFVGTDITPEYIDIAARRIIHWRRDELFAVEAS